MKVTYYQYHLATTDNRHINSLLPLLKKFCTDSTSLFRNSFIANNGERFFLFDDQDHDNIFTFIITKSQDLIKKINSKEFTYADIKDDLSTDESLGFASYIYFDDNHYGIASTLQGPKNKSFVEFINKLLHKLKVTAYFTAAPIPSSVSTQKAMSFDFIGRTTFEVSPENQSFGQVVSAFFGGSLPDELSSLEITIKPKRGKNLKSSFIALEQQYNLDDMKKLRIKAREELHDSLSDFFVNNNGYLSDFIKTNSRKSITNQILEKHHENSALHSGLEEYSNDKRFTRDEIDSLSVLYSGNTWSNIMGTYRGS